MIRQSNRIGIIEIFKKMTTYGPEHKHRVFFVLFFKITNQEFLHNPPIYKKNWDLGKEPSLITQEHQT